VVRVSRRRGYIVLKGDDGPLVERLPREAIWGKAVAFRDARELRRFVRTPLSAVIAALAGLPRVLHPLTRWLARALGALERQRLPRDPGGPA
jgi:hypothetical protein